MNATTALLLKNEYFVSVYNAPNYVEVLFPVNRLIKPQLNKAKVVYEYANGELFVDGVPIEIPSYAVRLAIWSDIYCISKKRGMGVSAILNLSPEYKQYVIEDMQIEVNEKEEYYLRNHLVDVAKGDFSDIPSELHDGCRVVSRCLLNGGLL